MRNTDSRLSVILFTATVYDSMSRYFNLVFHFERHRENMSYYPLELYSINSRPRRLKNLRCRHWSAGVRIEAFDDLFIAFEVQL